jgi:DNA helicase II / ATP-dependent DNA helicase PcrA
MVAAEKLLDIRSSLRPGQQEIADWQGGRLAVSAVPGAGKSTGMAAAAAITIASQQLHQRKQLIVVTFTRSAATNLKGKIRQHLKDLNLPPTGFLVQTLHSLAWSIASRHPLQSGLSSDSSLITASQSQRLIRVAVEQWITANPSRYQTLIEGQSFDGEETERLRRQSVLRTEILPALAHTAIHEAKSSGLLPEDIYAQSPSIDDSYETCAIAAGLYAQYQSLMRNRRLIDYEDIILASLQALQHPEIVQRWRDQVFAVFEDEAQDSSPLQTKLLELLSGNNASDQNLVRVGDPNQAINSTFTPADPIFFREFCASCAGDDRHAEMSQAGRSAEGIIRAANFMLGWTNQAYLRQQAEDCPPMGKALEQLKYLDEAPFRKQFIQPTEAGDPQPNPLGIGTGMEIHQPEDIYETLVKLGDRVLALFETSPESSAAVLVRTNEQGRFVAEELRRNLGDKLTLFEVGERDRRSQIPSQMYGLLQFLDRPHSPDFLKRALTVLVDRQLIPNQDLNALITAPEQFLYPGPLEPTAAEPVRSASRYCRSLLKARRELPLHQLIPFLAFTLGYDQSELATADKLLDRVMMQMTTCGMAEMLDVLGEIAGSDRFEAVDESEDIDRYCRSGQVTIITMHKAKGLDWDFVFLPFLQENVIPGSLWVPPQAQFLGSFALPDVARAQIRAMVHGREIPDRLTAWRRAIALKAAEEFRLLYVGMTRAKQLLWMASAKRAPFSWGNLENLDDRAACPVVVALMKQFPEAVVGK